MDTVDTIAPVNELITECYLAIDMSGKMTNDLWELDACQTYKTFLLKYENSIIWSSKLLFKHFSHNLYAGDLINKGLQLLSTPVTKENELLRNKLQKDLESHGSPS
jgi:hypothetical protein